MGKPNTKDLFLAERLDFDQAVSLLSPYGFKDIRKADSNLQAMADDPWARELLSEIIEELLLCIGQSPDPDQALNYLERFAQATGNKVHLFSYLKEAPRSLELLAKVFAGSQFLAEILIRNPVYLYWVSDPEVLNSGRGRRDLEPELSNILRHLKTDEKKLDALRIFKRKEILQIGVRDLLKLSTVGETVASLSTLAEVLISAAYRVCDSSMRRNYGTPFHKDRRRQKARSGFTILGLGKLGGGELNFSSDVDLMYLYASDRGAVSPGRSISRRGSISCAEYFEMLSRKITAALTKVTNEGYVYRVDLRLRPEGRMGSIASSLSGFRRYYASRGETWERLALLKAWPLAGDHSLGTKFLKMAHSFIYGRPFDLKALNQLRELKGRIDRKMAILGERHRNVKLGFGGIREIELVVQSLQVCFGRKFPNIRSRNTIEALEALLRRGLLSEEEVRSLRDAYIFLRDVENKLQMFLDFQTHSIPVELEKSKSCALRLGYRDTATSNALDEFLKDYAFHTAEVNRIFQTVFSQSEQTRFSTRA